MTFAHSHDLGGLRDGKLVFQNTVEYLNPCLFLLVQRYIPHRDDMFAEQLAGDRIVNSNTPEQHLAPPAQVLGGGDNQRRKIRLRHPEFWRLKLPGVCIDYVW